MPAFACQSGSESGIAVDVARISRIRDRGRFRDRRARGFAEKLLSRVAERCPFLFDTAWHIDYVRKS